MWNYSSEEAALEDVLNLSRGMTYKAACAGLNLGGGQGVILADPRTSNKKQLLACYGQAVNALKGAPLQR